MSLLLVGLSYKTAPLEVRERLAFSEGEIPQALAELSTLPGVRETLLLSTCHRTEIYLVGMEPPPAANVVQPLAAIRGLPTPEVARHLTRAEDAAAARHAIRVAAGLESMVPGEPQILGQVRRAYEIARRLKTTGPVLSRLMQFSLAAGRRVRRESGLASSRSVAHAALAFCRREWGTVEGRRILVVGAGEIGALVVRVFSKAGARIVAVANRTLQTAQAVASAAGALAIPLDAIEAELPQADALIVTIGTAEPVITVERLQRARPPVIIDLGVPRGVDPGAAELPGVHLWHLDDLAEASASLVPADALLHAEQVVAQALTAFLRWQTSRRAAPVIAALRKRADAIADDELHRLKARLRGLDDRQHEAIRAALRGAVTRLLHDPIVRLREGAASEQGQAVALVQQIFGLEETDRS